MNNGYRKLKLACDALLAVVVYDRSLAGTLKQIFRITKHSGKIIIKEKIINLHCYGLLPAGAVKLIFKILKLKNL